MVQEFQTAGSTWGLGFRSLALSFWKSPRRELLDQAQVRASYTPPPFFGVVRVAYPNMILDVQPLVKSFFCPIKRSPNGFFDSEASFS